MDPFFKGKIISVGISKYQTASSPDALKTTLGSCVGVVLYNQQKKHGGLAHILLAEAPAGRIVQKGKYAKPAINNLVEQIKKAGHDLQSYNARIFGGASMFAGDKKSFIQKIGIDNVNASKLALEELGINIIAEDIGETFGRNITLFLDDGRILIRANGKEKYIYKV